MAITLDRDPRQAASVLNERYELQHLLGKGGGGQVYRARQRSTGQLVAVKLLDFEGTMNAAARERRKERFRREMTICGRLTHPDIVRLIDFGELDESLYSVFELVPGDNLADVLQREGALRVARCHSLMVQLLRVLVYSHGLGVIHRDLKPSNLMVFGAPREQLKVLDFGISAMSSGGARTLLRLTLTNELVGTPAYAAPEQLRGEAPTAKTDLYSWGLILLECLTGTNPMFSASLGETFQRQLSQAEVKLPPRLLQHPLGTVLRRVLEKDPQRRAGSASDVLSRFEALSVTDLANAAGYFVESSPLSVQPSDAPPTRNLAPVRMSERRQVTALCCRLLMQRAGTELDPVLVAAYRADLFASFQATVESFGGTWVSGFGDLALFCFGLQRARDTGVRAAMRAALELTEQLRARSAALQAQSQLSVALRAGLHTGLLTAAERGAGQLMHGVLATTAMALSLRDSPTHESSITTSDAFRSLADRHAHFSAAGTLQLSFESAPSAVHRLLGETLSAVIELNGAPLVGREREIERLVESWQRTQVPGRRCAQTVVIQGEPGIGKSRLAHEFTRRARLAGKAGLTLRCQPELQLVALGPLAGWVRDTLGLDQDGAVTSATLARALAEFSVDPSTAVPLLCGWLAIPLSTPFAELPHSPQLQRGMLVELLVRLVCELTVRRGYLLIEDLHWADPRSLQWLGLYREALAQTGGFALVTTRPGVELQGDADLIALAALSDTHAAALVRALPASAQLGEQAIAQVVARADGVPLFVEELTRTVAARVDAAAVRNVPASLRDLLTSRLDELGSAKQTAQYAAAIGREFDIELLRASMAADEATVLADVDQLIAAGLVVTQRRVGHTSFLFRHALLRDAAYESLAHEACRGVHAAVAAALVRDFQHSVQARPDVLALHCERAGRAFEAQQNWLLAGRKAMRDVAYDEARGHFEHALTLVQQCPKDAPRDDAELDLLNALLAAHVVKFGYGAKELPAILARAQDRIEHGRASPARALPLLWGQYLFNTVRPAFRRALPIARDLLAVATQAGDLDFKLVGRSALIRCAFWMGDFAQVDPHHATLDDLYDPSRLKTAMEITGEDSYMAAASFVALALIVRGRRERGIAMLEALMATDERNQIPGLTEGTRAQAAFGYLLCGLRDGGGPDLERARSCALQARDSALRLGFPFWAGYAGLMEASARVYMGDPAAVDETLATMRMFEAAGADIGFGWNYCTVAHGLWARGELDAAQDALDAARRHVARSDERFFVSEQERLQAQLLLARSPSSRSEALSKLRGAAEVARSCGAQLFLERVQRDLRELGAC